MRVSLGSRLRGMPPGRWRGWPLPLTTTSGESRRSGDGVALTGFEGLLRKVPLRAVRCVEIGTNSGTKIVGTRCTRRRWMRVSGSGRIR